ncbi:hypothetical protein QE152_g36299 [Popillia japonica]|uniref:Uncharacterized protein n=1 Tax=Popillia japonica TaxID=7064 RepID=A0AAW1IDC3_POPJA
MSTNSEEISQLKDDVVNMRINYPGLVRKYMKKINKAKIEILENTTYNTEYHSLEIPQFPLEKCDEFIVENTPEKTKAKLKEEIIVMRTLLKRQKCSIASQLE